MTKLLYTPCKCIKRGDCFRPGTRGHLFVHTGKRIIPVRKCSYCK